MDDFDAVIIGAGVVGLAIARRLAQTGLETLILEAAPTFGTGISSRNSEVIHAGIYYPTGSLKARFCVEGRHLLYEYCMSRHVPHRQCGKLIVATTATEEELLQRLRSKAIDNGIDDLRPCTLREVEQLEPTVSCSAALLSPSTGIVDSHALMLALLGDFESAGGTVCYRTPVTGIDPVAGRLQVAVADAAGCPVRAALVINAAGLAATEVALRVSSLSPELVPARSFVKGHYFFIRGRSPFARLVYPLPERDGLGIHVTIDMSGRARLGPNAVWVATEDYEFDEDLKHDFYIRAKRYVPALHPEQLEPGYTGIRPRISSTPGVLPDFVIQDQTAHGIPGLFNLFGIESPGLTSSLAIAEEIARRCRDQGLLRHESLRLEPLR